jgi:hypothetical protein
MLRRFRMTGAEIAFCSGLALSTVSAVLAALIRPVLNQPDGQAAQRRRRT